VPTKNKKSYNFSELFLHPCHQFNIPRIGRHVLPIPISIPAGETAILRPSNQTTDKEQLAIDGVTRPPYPNEASHDDHRVP
jgi:hypothetical protein